MKLRNILATLFTVVALTACDKAEKIQQDAVEKVTETTAEVAKVATDKAAEIAEEAKVAASAKATEMAKALTDTETAATKAKEELSAKAAEVQAKIEMEAKAALDEENAITKAKSEIAEKVAASEAEAKAAADEMAVIAKAKADIAAKVAAHKAKPKMEVKAVINDAETIAKAKAEIAAKVAAHKAKPKMEVKAVVNDAETIAKAKAEIAAKVAAHKAKPKMAVKAVVNDAETIAKAKAEIAAKVAAVKAASMATAAAATTTMAKAPSADATKVGFVYVGPIGDHGWSYQHNQSRLAVEKALNVKTAYVESVPEGADAERVIRQLAADGNEVIFTTSFGYMNPTNKVAKMFPKVKFEHATGYKRADNVSTYSARFYEGRAVLGAIAGKMTKTNTIGYIASFPIPEVIRGINAMTLAARKVNPDVKVKVVWVNTWFDPGKEGDAAKALIDQGADVITQHTDSPAPLQVAEQRGVYGFGQASNMKAFAPKAQLTAIVNNWDNYYIKQIKAAQDGSWTSIDTWDGIKAGMVTMAPYGDAVPQDVRDYADSVKASIVDGSFHPFQGPIKNQAGEVVVAEGETVADGDLAKMAWYVEGVDGTIPK